MTFEETLLSYEIPPKPMVKMNTYLIHFPEQTHETTAPTLEEAKEIALYENCAVYDKIIKKEE